MNSTFIRKIIYLAVCGFCILILLYTVQTRWDPLNVDQNEIQGLSPNSEKFQLLKKELHHIIAAEWDEKNPFATSFIPKEKLTDDDYVALQDELKTLKVSELIDAIYPSEEGAPKILSKEEFVRRCTMGSRQVMIDPAKNLFPMRKLEKIGQGSDMCFISFCSYNKSYPAMMQAIPKALQETGFNGYFLYQVGGYPNPTGKETLFAGVPYAFKMFMMLEAYKLGFSKIIWIDSAVVPLNDPSPLFSALDSSEIYFYGTYSDEYKPCLFPSIQQELKNLTGTDVLGESHVYAPIIGFNMDSENVHKLIKSYYKIAAKGTPFISCAPEEFVLTAIVGQPEYKDFRAQFRHKLLQYPLLGHEDPNDLAQIKEKGFYFYHHTH